MKKIVLLLAIMSVVTLNVKADVKIDETTFPDENFRNWVLKQKYGKDGILTEEEIASVTFINLFPQNLIAKGQIKSLKGIEYFTAVTKLVCSRNELTELDLSKNTALTWLECNGNCLTELDLSENTELTYLDCNANELTALDVSCCNKLTELYCYINKLTTLNVSKGGAMTILKCDGNQLTVIDVSGCTSLSTLWCEYNQLSALNVLDCTSLSTLRCDNNQLTKLDVSKNAKLTDLQCGENKLTQLDVSNNTELKELQCENNQLTVLNLSKNKILTSLRTYYNPIKGEAMDALIGSLPSVNRGDWCCVFSKDEVDVVTTAQIAAAKVKGWTSYYWNEAAKRWAEYDGSTSTDDYRPLLEEGKVWKYSYNSFVREYMKSLTISGDTIIGNQTYKKIIDVASQAVEMALREEDKKVYCCYPNRDTEILLYDFGKNAGDLISKEIKDGDIWIRKVISVDTVMVKGNAFRCMKVDEYIIHGMTEEEFFAGNYGYSTGFWIEGIGSFTYLGSPIPYDGNYYTFYECSIGDMTINQKDFLDLIIHDNLPEYRPFVEDDKVWKVGDVTSGNPVQLVDYYFFDDDTIINGKTCKQMMRKRYVSPEHPNFDFLSQEPSLIYVGAWYEEDKKVYEYDTTLNQFTMMYDFSLEEGGIFQKDGLSYVIGPKQIGVITGFKGVYRNVRLSADGESVNSTPWLEGVGSLDCPTTSVYPGYVDPYWFLMECYVGDEVIYLNDECEDGATPELSGARKHRFDFTHTTKIQPKSRTRSEAEPSLYGEYSEHQLNIHLDPINDAYQVSITDASGKVAYQKTIDAGNIVGLNIDISSYPKGYYNVTVENDNESFTGTFEAQTTGIMDVRKKAEEAGDRIYNLQGQRLNSLQKGLNIVNGQKVYVK